MIDIQALALLAVIVVVIVVGIAYAVRESGNTLIFIGAITIICSPFALATGAGTLMLPIAVSSFIGGVVLCALGAIVNGLRATVVELKKLNARLDVPPSGPLA